MKIGIALPSLLASKHYQDRIFAPQELFVSLVNSLVKAGVSVYTYAPTNIKTLGISRNEHIAVEDQLFESVRDQTSPAEYKQPLTNLRNQIEYELTMLSFILSDAEKLGLDLVHIYMSYLVPYFSTLSKTPLVINLHDPVFSKDTLEYTRISYLNRLNLISLSERQKQTYQAILPEAKIETVHHGVNVNEMPFYE